MTMLDAVAKLDADARQVLRDMAARGRLDIASLSPLQARAALAGMPRPAGPVVHEVRPLSVAGAQGDIPARLYRPSHAPDLPVLVWFHGGGMVLGDLSTADWVCRELCMQADAAVVSVAYRLAPEHRFPAAPEDAYAATGWVAAHAAELGIDGARIAVGGDSAGGQLAAVTCLLARDRGGVRLRSQLLVYPGSGVGGDHAYPSAEDCADGPVLTRAAMTWFSEHYHGGAADESDLRAQPAAAASHVGLPPAFVVTAEVDPLRDTGEHYAGLLARAGVLTALKRYNGAFHGFFTWGPEMARTREAVADAARFLRLSWL
jgi:acetyl esterase